MAKIRVLVVDDSLFLRRTLPRILQLDPEIEVVGTAADGAEGLAMVKSLHPDVVTLDLMMPVMDGLTALRHIMREAPTPVVVVSALARREAQETLEALALGAIDFVTKPSGPVSLDIATVGAEIVEKVRVAYASKIKIAATVDVTREGFRWVVEGASRDGLEPVRAPSAGPHAGEPEELGEPEDAEEPGQRGARLIAIATSTGGPVALQHVLTRLPADLRAGIVIVVHITAGFTRPLVHRLDDLAPIEVRVARDGAHIEPGVALIAPSGQHMTVLREAEGFVARLSTEPSSTVYRPSADELFHSIAACCAARSCGVILTGMGNDGALGLRAIHDRGGYTLAQDEETAVVYGMPRRAVEMGAVDRTLPLDRIPNEIIRAVARAARQPRAAAS